MTKKVPFVVLLIFFLASGIGSVFGQTGDYEDEGWKKRFSSPTYGVALTPLELKYENTGNDYTTETIWVPGVDLRIYNGINVAKRGGFYTGYEVGVQFLFLGQSDIYETSSTTAQLRDLIFGRIFLLSKYGYRIDLGTQAAGFSVGAMFAIGAQMAGGGVDVYDADPAVDDTSYADYSAFGPLLEAGLEGAFRFGRNFRLYGVGGLMVGQGPEWSLDSGASQYIGGEAPPVTINLRAGFALNY